MSSLTHIDKLFLERILGMGGGYVLHYSDRTFGEFFRHHGVDIHAIKYQTNGTSKAKKMRTFWEIESDSRVGQVISDMLDEHEAHCQLGEVEVDTTILTKVREITHRLTNNHNVVMSSRSVDDFLAREFTIPDLEKLPVDLSISNIIRSRLDEAQSVLRVGACLSAIILWGSVLEAVLLGSAQEDPVRFNKAKASPKTLGTVKPFNNWNLSQFIDVAYEIGIIGPDVKEFSQGLREFRNFIHPKKQLESNFKPDDHTAGISFQVLKAALADLTGNRGQERDQT